jgi:hypothetical protein
MATTNQPDALLFFKPSITKFSYSSLKLNTNSVNGVGEKQILPETRRSNNNRQVMGEKYAGIEAVANFSFMLGYKHCLSFFIGGRKLGKERIK